MVCDVEHRHVANGLDRRHPCLHECEARKKDYGSTMPSSYAAEKRGARRQGCLRSSRLTTLRFRFHVKCFLIVTAIFSKSAIVLPTVVDSPSFFTSVIPVFGSERTVLISSHVAANLR
jgi:hypothetical protein